MDERTVALVSIEFDDQLKLYDVAIRRAADGTLLGAQAREVPLKAYASGVPQPARAKVTLWVVGRLRRHRGGGQSRIAPQPQ